MAALSTLTMIYSTCPNQETAEAIATTLLSKKLAVCISISSPVTSFYHWDGTLHKDLEVQLFIKTNKPNVASVFEAITKLHPYQVPCLLEIPLDAVGEPYSKWASECL
jgi:periplasmic divalent cation tolerance protein